MHRYDRSCDAKSAASASNEKTLVQDAEFQPARQFDAISDGDMDAAACLRKNTLAGREACRCQRRIDDDTRHTAGEHAPAFVARLTAFALVAMIAGRLVTVLVRRNFFVPGMSMVRATAQQRVRQQRDGQGNCGQ
jgi:hypothetical protein